MQDYVVIIQGETVRIKTRIFPGCKMQLKNSFENLVAQLQCICFCLRATMQAVNNFLHVTVTKANQFQTKITSKVVPKSTKIAYI